MELGFEPRTVVGLKTPLSLTPEDTQCASSEETELVASRSIKAVIIRANSITYFQSGGTSTMWGRVYCSVVLITEDSMVGETVTWNQKTLT